jgi:hypothetical protein
MSTTDPFVRPDWVRRINLFGDAVGDPHNLVSLDADEMIETARRTTGLAEFGDGAWEAPYRSTLSAIDAHGELTVLGRLSTRAEILRCLQTRLRLEDLWAREPDVRSAPITRPVFILGPPRTGTSILLELMALDPTLRPIIAHEAHNPLGPLPGVDRSVLELAEPEQEFWADIQPEFMTMHELRGDLPCECVHFVAPVFDSWHWSMMHNLAETPNAGSAPIYEFHKAFLQTVQHLAGRPQNFLLKSPAHLGSLTDLLAVYPDARLIHTHRDPLRFVGSSANIITALRWMRSDNHDGSDAGPLMSLAYQLMLGLVMGQRASGEVPKSSMADLHFTDLAAKPKGKFGTHSYDPVALGLDESVVRSEFANYIDRYGIELET